MSAISEGRRQSLRETLPRVITDKYGIKAASSFEDFLNAKDPFMLTLAPFDEGLIIPVLFN